MDTYGEEHELLERCAQQVGIRLAGWQIERLLRFLDLLELWSNERRLVGTRERPRLITHHIVDSLAAAPAVGTCETIIDIGSGAGLPGIPLAIACPTTSFTLVDSRGLAASFLGEAARVLAAKNVRILQERAEKVAPIDGPIYSATIARAWASLREFLGVSHSLLKPDGIAVAMKGPRWNEEMESLGSEAMGFRLVRNISYRLPATRGRMLLVFRRRGAGFSTRGAKSDEV